MSIQKLLVTLIHSTINPKSMDLVFPGPIASDIKIKVVDSDNVVVPSKIVETSTNPKPENITLIFDPDFTNSTPLLQLNKDYSVIVEDSTGVVFTETFTVSEFPAMMSPKVRTFGTRLIEITFDYPVDDLYSSHDIQNFSGSNVTANVLSNFYMKLFGEDISQSLTSDPLWSGFFINLINSNTPFSLFPSKENLFNSDNRTILIQSNLKSLPISDKHLLQVASSRGLKHIDSNLVLTDFTPEQRHIPISEVPFILRTAQYTAKLTNITALSPVEFIVTFDTEVCLLPAEVSSAIKINGLSVTPKSVERLTRNYKALKFTLAKAITSPSALITVGSLTDSSGFKTVEKTFTVDIPIVKPEFIAVEQVPATSPNTTDLILTFSQPLDSSDVIVKENYTVNDGISDFPILDITTVTDSVVKLTFSPELPTGVYEVTAENIKNTFGVSMDKTTLSITISDFTVPEVVNIFGTTNAPTGNDTLLIMYNEAMNIASPFAANEAINYKLKDVVFPSNSTASAFAQNKWFRFNLNKSITLTETDEISIGYVGLSKVYYVTNKSGNVYPLCIKKTPTLLEQLDLNPDVGSPATATILNSKTVQLKLTQPTHWFDPFKLTVADFIFDFGTPGSPSLKKADTIYLIENTDYKTINLVFNEQVFNASHTKVSLNLDTSNGRLIVTEDLLSRPIKCTSPITLTNTLSSSLLSISKLDYDKNSSSKALSLALKYDKAIFNLDTNDFIIKDNNDVPFFITPDTSNIATEDSTIILLNAYALGLSSPNFNSIFVSTNGPQNGFATIDISRKQIPVINNVLATEYSITDIVVSTLPSATTSLSGLSLKVAFDRPFISGKALSGSSSTPSSAVIPAPINNIYDIPLASVILRVKTATGITLSGNLSYYITEAADNKSITITVVSSPTTTNGNVDISYIEILQNGYKIISADNYTILSSYYSPKITTF